MHFIISFFQSDLKLRYRTPSLKITEPLKLLEYDSIKKFCLYVPDDFTC